MSQKVAPAFLLLICLSFLRAEESRIYTLEDCVQQALSNNPAAAIAKSTEEAAREDVATARGKYYPEVGVQSVVKRWETHAFLPAGIGGPGFPSFIGPINDWQLNVRANYVVYDSGLRSSDIGTAQAQLSAAQEESGRTRADIIYRVQVAYFEALQAKDGVELAKGRQTRSKDHLGLAQEKKDAGAVPQADVTRSRTEVASAELDVASAESTLRIALGRLNEVMGHPPNEPIQIAKAVQAVPDPSQASIEQFMQKAITSRPEIRAAQSRAEAKRSQIGAVRSEILPKLRAEAGYGWRDDDFDPPDKDWWVGVTLNIPLFDGGVRSHRIAKSRIEANREDQQVALIKLSVQQEVWSAYSRWIEAFQALQSSGVMKQEASESVDLVKARYEEGAGTINDLLDAEFSLNQSETQLSNARYRLQVAHAAFLHAVGEN